MKKSQIQRGGCYEAAIATESPERLQVVEKQEEDLIVQNVVLERKPDTLERFAGWAGRRVPDIDPAYDEVDDKGMPL